MRLSKYCRQFVVICAALAIARGACAQSTGDRVRLSGHLPLKALSNAQTLGDVAADDHIQLLLTVPNPKSSEIKDLIERMYDPASPQYHKFLKPHEFTQRFASSPDDVAKVSNFAQAHGLSVTGVLPNNRGVKVAGSAADIGKAFGINLKKYRAFDGRLFRASDNEPSIPAELGGHLTGIVGLDSANDGRRGLKPQIRQSVFAPHAAKSRSLQWVDAVDVMEAYGLSSVSKSGDSLTGQGQTVALVEFELFDSSDINTFKNDGPPQPFTNSITTISVDGGAESSSDNDGTETDLDIDVLGPMIPNGSIQVYQGPDTDIGGIDTYFQIASDDTAQVVSVSWGIGEDEESPSVLNAESEIYQQMAAQGQTVIVASGDDGAFTDRHDVSPTVSDPASQPFVTAVGGTTLTTTDNFAYVGESTWNQSTTAASGGGISSHWGIPSWQSGIHGASSSKRNVPDLALKADFLVPYIVYHNGWIGVGGTSAAAPFFAGFIALTNEARGLSGFGSIGYINPALYKLAKSNAAKYFHDITTGSNWKYTAAKGYDNTTGWGSIRGDAFLDVLSSAENPAPSPAPTGLGKPTKLAVLIKNGRPTISFSTVSGAKSYAVSITNANHAVVVPAVTAKKSPVTINKTLKKGVYTVTIVAKNPTTHSANATKSFRIG